MISRHCTRVPEMFRTQNIVFALQNRVFSEFWPFAGTISADGPSLRTQRDQASAGRTQTAPADGTRSEMPPPAGSIGAGEGAANMAFRRRSSATSNNTAEQARAALVHAFEEADLDHSGMVNKEELAVVIRDQLHIQLQDPVNDLDIIFGLATHTCARHLLHAMGAKLETREAGGIVRAHYGFLCCSLCLSVRGCAPCFRTFLMQIL